MGANGQKFAVLTTGRAGSSSFVQALHQIPGLVTPANSTDINQPELLNPRFRADFFSIYSGLCGRNLKTELDLIEAFYAQHQSGLYAGFKALYSQVSSFDLFKNRSDVTFVVLLRRDVVSTIASLMVAMDRGCWGRRGESHRSAWRFNPVRLHELNALVVAHHAAIDALLRVPNSIVITYEDLCRERFADSRLNAFLGLT